MGDKRSKQRISSKIDELPEDLRRKVDVMLADTSNTYEYISQFLKGEGYDISKSSVGRYATRTNNAMQRLLEAQAQTDRLIQVVKENPEADYTEAAILLTMNGLLNKVATAEDEFNEMPLDKAGRLIASLSRTKVYKDRVKQDILSMSSMLLLIQKTSLYGRLKEILKGVLTISTTESCYRRCDRPSVNTARDIQLSVYAKTVYNFEYFMNREYAYNRDKGKCKCCKKPLFLDNKKYCYHVKGELPLGKVNKVQNLVWLCNDCYRMVNNGPIPPNIDEKVLKKIQKYKQK